MTSLTVDPGLLESVACPNCASIQADAIVESSYPGDLSASAILEQYSASSSHKLHDALVRCRDCHLVFSNPRIRADLIRASYAETVDPLFVAQNAARIQTFRRSLRDLCGRLNLTASKELRVLDVGCGGGAFPKAAADEGFSVVGVEPSKWLAEYGRQAYRLDIRTGFLEDQDLGDLRFDIASLWDVIEHAPDPGALLGSVRALLKPGGVLVVNFPDYDSMARRVLGKKWPMFLSVHLSYFTKATMRSFVSRRGFEVVFFRPHWQTLPLGYVLERASSYFRIFGLLKKAVERIGAATLPVTYNVGQSLLVARRRDP